MATQENKAMVLDYVDVEFPAGKDVLTLPENLEKLADVFEETSDVEKVQALAKEILAAAGRTPGETDAFGDNGKKPSKKRTQTGKTNKVVADEASRLLQTNYGACAMVVSVKGAVVGYLTPTPDHFDISKTTKTTDANETITSFGVKMVGPGPVRGFIVALPLRAIEAVRSYTRAENGDPNSCDVAAAQDANQPFTLEIQTPEYFTESFLNSEAAGSIREADELWAPTTTRRYMNATKDYRVERYATLADLDAVKANDNIIAGKNAIAFQMSYKKVNNISTPVSRAKHTLRARFQTPGNFVPARKYETIKIKDAYSAEEAKSLNETYFGRYSTAKYKSVPLLSTIAANDTTVQIATNPENNSKYIASTGFFATNAAESAMRGTVAHWSMRGEDGLPQQVELLGQDLIKRVSEVGKTGKAHVVIKYQEIQATQNAAGNAYVPDFDGEFAKIGNACKAFGVKLEAADLVKFFHDTNVIRTKEEGRAKGRKTAPKPMGLAAFGFSATAKSAVLQEALKSLETA